MNEVEYGRIAMVRGGNLRSTASGAPVQRKSQTEGVTHRTSMSSGGSIARRLPEHIARRSPAVSCGVCYGTWHSSSGICTRRCMRLAQLVTINESYHVKCSYIMKLC